MNRMENTQANADKSTESTADKTPQVVPPVQRFDFSEPYKHAPPKPDGDPWAILLEPELEADKMRCEAWKEEVQTLLIFAGLFSAVVTAFVVESYRFLRPDPNDAIVGLLFYIASSVNTSSPSPFPFPPAVNLATILTPSAQSSSSVRINVFWFLSLILSLTTVLAGTIALQWLREHQSYTPYSAKESLAILNMRTEALEAWHVPQIFAGLPLLLQAALVLFLAGLIDFSLSLGLGVAIPVCVIIGLTLLFLAVTTVFPTFQALSFLTGLYSRNQVPAPCAFRSPQSYAFHSLSAAILHLLSYIIPQLSIFPNKNGRYREPPADRRHLSPSLFKIWDQESWNFDMEWLSLRDAFHQSILDTDPNLSEHRLYWEEDFPLSDLTECIMNVVEEDPSVEHSEQLLAATYYCFQEISSPIWSSFEHDHRRADRRHHYFQQLCGNSYYYRSVAMSLIHGGLYKFERFSTVASSEQEKYMEYTRKHFSLFREDQMLHFLHMMTERPRSSTVALASHQFELWSRITQYLLTSRIVPLTPYFYQNSNLLANIGFSTVSRLGGRDTSYYYPDIANVLNSIFRLIASNHIIITKDQLTNPEYYMEEQTIPILQTLAWATAIGNIRGRKISESISQYCNPIFEFVTERLDSETTSSLPEAIPCHLFYVSSVFARELMLWSHVDSLERIDLCEGFVNMVHALRRYKAWTSGRRNEIIEKQFGNQSRDFITQSNEPTRFSDEWWDTLFKANMTDDDAQKDITIGQVGQPIEVNHPTFNFAPSDAHLPSSAENVADVLNVNTTTQAAPLTADQLSMLNANAGNGAELDKTQFSRDSIIDITPASAVQKNDSKEVINDVDLPTHNISDIE